MILREKHKNNVDCAMGYGRCEPERMLLAGGDAMTLIPIVVEQPAAVSGPTTYIPGLGRQDRLIGGIDDSMANPVIAQMRFQGEDPDKDINLTSIARRVCNPRLRYTIRCSMKPRPHGVGLQPAWQLCCWRPARGQALCSSVFARHDTPAFGGTSGQATDIEIREGDPDQENHP